MKSKRLFKYLLFFLTASLLVVFVKELVFAQEVTGLAISPPNFELSANPGDTIVNSIKVQNVTDAPISVTVDRRNFTALGEEGAVGLTEEETAFSLAAWISVSPEEAEIAGNTTRVFSFNLVIPRNAEPGGHFGSIVFVTGGKLPEEQTGVAVAQEVGALLLVRVAGRVTEQAVLESFSAEKNFFEYGPATLIARVKNQGNVHIKPTGTVDIYNIFGKKVASVAVEPKNVLPEAIRKIPATWERKLLFGKYTANLSLVYGTENKILTASTTFIGFPYRIGGAVALVLLFLLAIGYKGRRRLSRALRVLFGR